MLTSTDNYRSGFSTSRLRDLVLLVGLAVTIGVLSSYTSVVLFAGVAGMAIVVGIAAPQAIAIAAIPGTMLLFRVGSGGSGSSVDYSDIILLLAFVVALPLVRWHQAQALRRMLGLTVVYLGLLLLSVVANPNSHAVIEWTHRVLLLGGALIVGWVIAQRGNARQAFSVFLVGAGILAAITIAVGIGSGFRPAQFGVYQKNTIGGVMWIAIVVAHLNPSWVGATRKLALSSKYLCVAGLLATQSKQSIAAVVVAVVIGAVRQKDVRKRSGILIGALIPLAIFAYLVSRQEISSYRAHINSLTVRQSALTSDLHVWHLDIWFGQGPRWFYLKQFAAYIQPPNIGLEALTDSGLIGFVGLLILLVGAALLLRRVPPTFGTLALAIAVGRFVESLFDLYWVSGVGALPWLVAGMALGAADMLSSQASTPLRRAK